MLVSCENIVIDKNFIYTRLFEDKVFYTDFPITLYKNKDKFILLDGFKRFTAALKENLQEISIKIIDGNLQDAFIKAFETNLKTREKWYFQEIFKLRQILSSFNFSDKAVDEVIAKTNYSYTKEVKYLMNLDFTENEISFLDEYNLKSFKKLSKFNEEKIKKVIHIFSSVRINNNTFADLLELIYDIEKIGKYSFEELCEKIENLSSLEEIKKYLLDTRFPIVQEMKISAENYLKKLNSRYKNIKFSINPNFEDDLVNLALRINTENLTELENITEVKKDDDFIRLLELLK